MMKCRGCGERGVWSLELLPLLPLSALRLFASGERAKRAKRCLRQQLPTPNSRLQTSRSPTPKSPSPLLRRRANSYTDLPVFTGRAVLLLVGLVGNRELSTAFGAAAGDQLAAALRAHAAAETMFVYTTTLGGLERSFHYSLVWEGTAEPTGRFVKGRKGKDMYAVMQNDSSIIYWML